MELDRRTFLKGAALAGVGAATTGALAACSTGDDKGSGSQTSPAASTPDTMNAQQFMKQWAFEVPPAPIPDDQITETIETELLIVGAGTGGLVTANSAIEEGLKVTLISASTMPIARGGSNNAVYSKAMEAAGLSRVDVWDLQKEILAQLNLVDQKKWFKYYNNSEEATNWMIDIMEGAGFYTAVEQNNYIKQDSLYGQPLCSHSWVETPDSDKVSRNQPALVAQLAKRLEELGGTIVYQMKGVQLEREDNNTGRVTAVIVEDLANGGYKRFKGSRAVVLATGDFSADRDMMLKYCYPYASMISDEVYDGPADYDRGFTAGGLYKGDMHKAALWIGAAWQKVQPNCAMAGLFSGGPIVNRYQNFPGLLLDRNGERFMNEYASRPLGPITQSMQDGKLTYAIWDTTWYDNFEWYNGNYSEQNKPLLTKEEVVGGWDKKVKDGTAVKADTIEELVKLAELPDAAVAAIKKYNTMCDAGKDTDFYKDGDSLFPIKTPPFYCEKRDFSVPTFHTVLGGIRCNDNCQVKDANDKIIPGLYVVGTMMGDLWAGLYTFMIQGGNYGISCLTFGYLTGKFIAKNK